MSLRRHTKSACILICSTPDCSVSQGACDGADAAASRPVALVFWNVKVSCQLPDRALLVHESSKKLRVPGCNLSLDLVTHCRELASFLITELPAAKRLHFGPHVLQSSPWARLSIISRSGYPMLTPFLALKQQDRWIGTTFRKLTVLCALHTAASSSPCLYCGRPRPCVVQRRRGSSHRCSINAPGKLLYESTAQL